MLYHLTQNSLQHISIASTFAFLWLLAIALPAKGTTVPSSHGKLVNEQVTSNSPSALLDQLLRSRRPLNWRQAPKSEPVSNNQQIIWPPIDQPLDLRGGYKRPHQSGREPVGNSSASTPTLSQSDCEAAGAFIMAGARARDNGVSAAQFLGQLRSDLLKLAAEPPARRWFLHSQLEARLLLRAANRLYSDPRAATWHFKDFMESCDAHRASR